VSIRKSAVQKDSKKRGGWLSQPPLFLESFVGRSLSDINQNQFGIWSFLCRKTPDPNLDDV
jgi:hypothetical protein